MAAAIPFATSPPLILKLPATLFTLGSPKVTVQICGLRVGLGRPLGPRTREVRNEWQLSLERPNGPSYRILFTEHMGLQLEVDKCGTWERRDDPFSDTRNWLFTKRTDHYEEYMNNTLDIVKANNQLSVERNKKNGPRPRKRTSSPPNPQTGEPLVGRTQASYASKVKFYAILSRNKCFMQYSFMVVNA